jgi:hypothetical protein
LIFFEKLFENRKKLVGGMLPLHFAFYREGLFAKPDLKRRVHPYIGIGFAGRSVRGAIQKEACF